MRLTWPNTAGFWEKEPDPRWPLWKKRWGHSVGDIFLGSPRIKLDCFVSQDSKGLVPFTATPVNACWVPEWVLVLVYFISLLTFSATWPNPCHLCKYTAINISRDGTFYSEQPLRLWWNAVKGRPSWERTPSSLWGPREELSLWLEAFRIKRSRERQRGGKRWPVRLWAFFKKWNRSERRRRRKKFW